MLSPLMMSVTQCDSKNSKILLNAGASLNSQFQGSDVVEVFDRDLDPSDRDLYQCSLVRDMIKTVSNFDRVAMCTCDMLKYVPSPIQRCGRFHRYGVVANGDGERENVFM